MIGVCAALTVACSRSTLSGDEATKIITMKLRTVAAVKVHFGSFEVVDASWETLCARCEGFAS